MSKRQPKAEATVPAPVPSKRDPTPREAAAIAKATAYCRSRAEAPTYQVKGVEGRTMSVECPHNELVGFTVQQNATFGTASTDFASQTAAEAFDIVRSRGQPLPTQDQMNAAAAAVAGIEPQNEAEAMLAVQMVGTHSVAMDMLSRAKQAANPDQLERFGTLATKLLRTYTTQLEALAKVRRGGAQKVIVEHVHVHAGGQAIVGNVTGGQGGAPRGQIDNGQQAHAHALTGPAALAFQADPSMLCEDAGRDALPVASGEGEGPMPDARRGQGKRSPKG
jgi:hypothetical protein